MNRILIRVVGAPLLLGALALCLYLDRQARFPAAIAVVLALFAAVSIHELCSMARLKAMRPAEAVAIVAVLLSYMPFLGIDASWLSLQAMALAATVAVLLLLVIRYRDFTPLDAGYTMFALGYVSLLQFVLLGAPKEPAGRMLWLLFLLASNKGSDMAAYVAGKLAGRHKLAPSISPNKTWEGAIAGLVGGTLLGAWALAGLKETGPHALILGIALAVTVAAQMGDLVKSAVKRWAGVKDSGRLLPEFGGALDMVDSFILSAPVAAILTDRLL